MLRCTCRRQFATSPLRPECCSGLFISVFGGSVGGPYVGCRIVEFEPRRSLAGLEGGGGREEVRDGVWQPRQLLLDYLSPTPNSHHLTPGAGWRRGGRNARGESRRGAALRRPPSTESEHVVPAVESRGDATLESAAFSFSASTTGCNKRDVASTGIQTRGFSDRSVPAKPRTVRGLFCWAPSPNQARLGESRRPVAGR